MKATPSLHLSHPCPLTSKSELSSLGQSLGGSQTANCRREPCISPISIHTCTIQLATPPLPLALTNIQHAHSFCSAIDLEMELGTVPDSMLWERSLHRCSQRAPPPRHTHQLDPHSTSPNALTSWSELSGLRWSLGVCRIASCRRDP